MSCLLQSRADRQDSFLTPCLLALVEPLASIITCCGYLFNKPLDQISDATSGKSGPLEDAASRELSTIQKSCKRSAARNSCPGAHRRCWRTAVIAGLGERIILRKDPEAVFVVAVRSVVAERPERGALGTDIWSIGGTGRVVLRVVPGRRETQAVRWPGESTGRRRLFASKAGTARFVCPRHCMWVEERA